MLCCQKSMEMNSLAKINQIRQMALNRNVLKL